MITQEHLEHWCSEIAYALNGINNEINDEKLKGKTGIRIAVSPLTAEDVFVSFEYLQEKSTIIKGLLHCIEDDIKRDKIQIKCGSCDNDVDVNDIEQHLKEKHYRDTY